MRWGVSGLRLILTTFCVVTFLASASADNWPRFRGPNGTGVCADRHIPVTWSEKNHVLWKVETLGVGNSSPVIWGERLFLQASKDDGTERMLVCMSVKDGKTLWTRTAPASKVTTHGKNSMASSTPATDGERVYVLFWDSKAIAMHAYDLEGNPVWKQGLGEFIRRPSKGEDEKNQHGAGASPVVYHGKVYLNNDQSGMAELVALDAKTGRLIWKAPRPAFRTCYSTPFLQENPGHTPELIISSTAGVTSYEPDTGKINWDWKWTTFEGMALRTVGSPIASNGLIVATSGDGSGARHAVAIRANGKGDVTQTHLAWEEKKRVFPYVPSLLTLGEHIYSVNDLGIAHCHEAKSGKMIWSERLGGNVSASPLLINGMVYVINEEGTGYVFAATPTFELLAKNPLNERVIASPAVANGKLYIRTAKHLYCFARPTPQ